MHSAVELGGDEEDGGDGGDGGSRDVPVERLEDGGAKLDKVRPMIFCLP